MSITAIFVSLDDNDMLVKGCDTMWWGEWMDDERCEMCDGKNGYAVVLSWTLVPER